MQRNSVVVPWQYNQVPVWKSEDIIIPSWAIGFVYSIQNTETGKLYIGKKALYSTKKSAIGKRELAKNKVEATDKRKVKKVKTVTRDSDWLYYNSSNKELAAEILANPERFTKHILEFCYSNIHLTYTEQKYQYIHCVLEQASYNDNIAGKIFRESLLKNKPNI
jgi:hypothetical protein